jgi:hypothetical protein
MILALFLMTALSALGASLMFLSQSETYASMNYRMMSQGRYAAEAGVQKAANFLFDPAQYTIPGGGVDNLALYNRSVSPVTVLANGNPVVLSAEVDAMGNCVGANYPVPAVQAAFCNAAKGTLAAGSNANVTFNATATLVSMQQFESYGGAPNVVQTWRITGTGGVVGGRTATVQVSSLVETPKIPANTYAAFATNNGCAALSFNGNITIDSYDSTGMSGVTSPTLMAEGGDVGTNGNLTITGGAADVNGNLYTPRSGVGTCTAGAVTAFTGASSTVHGSIFQLPTPVTFPAPPMPPPSPFGAVSFNSEAGACANVNLALAIAATPGATCDDTMGDIRINGNGQPMTLPSISLGGGTKLVLVAADPPATYNVNSISLAGGSSVGIAATSPNQGALVKVIGQDNLGADIANPIDFVGGTFASVVGCASCSTYDASMLQFIYSGTGLVRLTGNSGAAATFYAPNAAVQFAGTADLYGSVLGATISNIGSGNIHYDQRLQRDFYVAGHPMAGTFTWTRF